MSSVRPEIRRPWRRRITASVWGALIATVGVIAVVELQGHNVDLELVVIAALVVLGGWLLFSALVPPRKNAVTASARAHTDDAAVTAASSDQD